MSKTICTFEWQIPMNYWYWYSKLNILNESFVNSFNTFYNNLSIYAIYWVHNIILIILQIYTLHSVTDEMRLNDMPPNIFIRIFILWLEMFFHSIPNCYFQWICLFDENDFFLQEQHTLFSFHHLIFFSPVFQIQTHKRFINKNVDVFK